MITAELAQPEISVVDLSRYPDATIGRDVTVKCRSFQPAGAFTLGDGVHIEADNVVLGNHALIEAGVQVRAINGLMQRFEVGDETQIARGTQVLLPEFVMGDYTRIFNNVLANGYKPMRLGHNCWVGQGTVLNAAETLSIGNNVRIGLNMQIWTHVASGELLEGSRFYGTKPVIIEDDVWFVGGNTIVSPGVVLARATVVMAGSSITKSTEPGRTYSGCPARDITEKIPAWNPVTIEQKIEMLRTFVAEFITEVPAAADRVFVIDETNHDTLPALLARSEPALIFLKDAGPLERYNDSIHSVFDVTTKRYTKRRTKLEVQWHRFAVGARARFIPVEAQ